MLKKLYFHVMLWQQHVEAPKSEIFFHGLSGRIPRQLHSIPNRLAKTALPTLSFLKGLPWMSIGDPLDLALDRDSCGARRRFPPPKLSFLFNNSSLASSSLASSSLDNTGLPLPRSLPRPSPIARSVNKSCFMAPFFLGDSEASELEGDDDVDVDIANEFELEFELEFDELEFELSLEQ